MVSPASLTNVLLWKISHMATYDFYVWKIEAGGCCILCIYPPGGPVHGLFGGEQRLDPKFFYCLALQMLDGVATGCKFPLCSRIGQNPKNTKSYVPPNSWEASNNWGGLGGSITPR